MQRSSLSIRAATIADLEQILALINQKAAFDGVHDPIAATVVTLQHALFGDRPCAEVALAEVDAIAVGFVLFFQTYSSFLAQPAIWIDDLFVRSNWRRQGIGTALLQHVAQIAQTRNCGRMEWTVATHNPLAIQFYKQQGAQIREEVRLCRVTASTIAGLAQSPREA